MSTDLGAGVGPQYRLDGPLPLPRRYSLLQVAQFVPATDVHWLNGVWLQSYPMDPVQIQDPCAAGTFALKEIGGALSSAKFGSFTAYLPITCNAGQIGPNPDWFTARAVQAFKVAEDMAAERALATGAGVTVVGGAETPHLTDTNLDQLDGGAAVSAKHGLESLEQAIGATGRGGVIHADPATATAWASYGNLIEPDSAGTMRAVATGTPIAVGDGYIGVFPDGGSPAGARQSWAFATGMVRVLTDPSRDLPPMLVPGEYRQAIDTGTNEVTWRAERQYVIAFDSDTNDGADYAPLQAGVLIDRSIATP